MLVVFAIVQCIVYSGSKFKSPGWSSEEKTHVRGVERGAISRLHIGVLIVSFIHVKKLYSFLICFLLINVLCFFKRKTLH